MDLQIKGQKRLNSNRYQRILIKSRSRDIEKGLIEASGYDVQEKDYPLGSISLSTPKFMDTIKGLTEIEKVKEVIEYFSRNNAICKMMEGNGVHVYSTCGRRLDVEMGFSSEDYAFMTETIGNLIRNYLDHRQQFLEKYKTCKCFHINGNSELSTYEIYEDLDGSNQTIWLHLLCKERFEQLRTFESQFLEDFIFEKVREQEKLVIIEDYWRYATTNDYWRTQLKSLNVHEYSISCGDLTFKFSNMATEYLCNLTYKMNEYNETFKAQEAMQLKLDLGGMKE